MKSIGLLMVLVGMISLSASASTVAYWRFEEGPAGAQVAHPAASGQYYAAAADSSGNGNELSV